jgi:hypothetical protein
MTGRPHFITLKYWSILSIGVLFGGSLLAASPDTNTPVIVELFTAEGCSSCPPADELLARLEKEQPVPGVDVIVLGEHVDYWNQLGWPDRFSDRLYTQRQKEYAYSFSIEDIYTPQMIVNGQAQFNGADGPRAIREIQHAAAAPHSSVSLQRKDPSDLALTVSHLPAGIKNVEIFLAITEDSLTSDVRRGENVGRRLTHTGVVRSFVSVARLDARKSPEFTGDLPLHLLDDWARENLHAVVLVEVRGSHRIVGAAQLKLTQPN